jgi:hypothetical protein
MAPERGRDEEFLADALVPFQLFLAEVEKLDAKKRLAGFLAEIRDS